MDENHDELIAQFVEISGSDDTVARFYLSTSNWSLEDALSNFLGNQSDDAPSRSSAAEAIDVTPQDLHSPTTTSATSAQSAKPDSFGTKSSAKPRFATLNDMSQRSSDDEEGQAFYAGGSERSGQQVLGPPKRKNFREQLTDMFRMAHEQSSGRSSEESGGGGATPSTSSRSNWGQGVRLGMTDNDHAVVKNPSKDGDKEKRPIVVLKLWSQGFSINDGELRLYDDPENKEFLETVMRGEIPTELLEMGWMVNVDVEDHRQEDYKKKVVPIKNFKGSGQTLGSPAPNVEEDVVNTTLPASQSSTEESEKQAKENLKIDTTAPTTSLQIRLADGTRLAAQFNLTHTIDDIRQYIQNARPQYMNQNYTLVSSFPTRELTDVTATIESAGLKNAALMQRLK